MEKEKLSLNLENKINWAWIWILEVHTWKMRMPIGCRNCYYLNQFILCIITFRSLRFFSAIVLCKTFFFQPLHYAKCLPFAFSSSKFSNIIVYVHCIHNNYTMTIFTPSLNLSPSLMSTLLPPTYHFLLSSFLTKKNYS